MRNERFFPIAEMGSSQRDIKYLHRVIEVSLQSTREAPADNCSGLFPIGQGWTQGLIWGVDAGSDKGGGLIQERKWGQPRARVSRGGTRGSTLAPKEICPPQLPTLLWLDAGTTLSPLPLAVLFSVSHCTAPNGTQTRHVPTNLCCVLQCQNTLRAL